MKIYGFLLYIKDVYFTIKNYSGIKEETESKKEGNHDPATGEFVRYQK
jgi:hypothetical protein